MRQNFYELLGMAVSVDVDIQQLTQNYQALQAELHPDRYVNATPQEKKISLQLSAQVSEGCRILKNPILRVNYWLLQMGVEIDLNQSQYSDGEFLEKQMELREAFMSAKFASDINQLEHLKSEIDSSFAEYYAQLIQLCDDQVSKMIDETTDKIITEIIFSSDKEKAECRAEMEIYLSRLKFLEKIGNEVSESLLELNLG